MTVEHMPKKAFNNSKPSRRTEYEGVIYESISEAYIAVLFDTCSDQVYKTNVGEFRYTYSFKAKPSLFTKKLFNQAQYRPDFELTETIYDMNKHRAITRRFVVEAKSVDALKPLQVHAARYKLDELKKDNADYFNYTRAEPLIITGDFFSIRKASVYLYPDEFCPLVLDKNVQYTSNYRFDNN